jgi:hypothetical protein
MRLPGILCVCLVLFTGPWVAKARAFNGYSTPRWRDVVYNKSCTDFALFRDVVVANDNVDCSVSTALLLLLRQSFRHNKHKWIEDARYTETRLTRMLHAHELTTRNHDAKVRYHEPTTMCMLPRNATPSDLVSSLVTAVTALPSDGTVATFAAFGAPTLSPSYLTVQQYVNGTTKIALDEAFGLHAINNHSPSAAFLPSHELAVGNAGWNDYDVVLYKQNNKNYTNENMASPFRIGGENIGSLFEWNKNVYLSARLNVPYVPLDVTGHGYRSIGLWKVDASESTSELVDWVAPDACITPCLDQMHHSCDGILTINASAVLSCLPTMTSGFIHEKPYGDCFRGSFATTSDACMQRKQEKFIEGLLCAHRCRVDNQLYQPSVSPVDDLLYGVTSRTSWLATQENNTTPSPLHFCRLSKSFAWNPACFDADAPSMRDTHGTPGHAVTSQLVKAGDYVYLGSPGGPKQAPECSAVLHRWNASSFSYLASDDEDVEIMLPNVVLPANRQLQLWCSCGNDAARLDRISTLVHYADKQCPTQRQSQIAERSAERIDLEVSCEPNAAKVELHILLPKGCQLFGIGPREHQRPQI